MSPAATIILLDDTGDNDDVITLLAHTYKGRNVEVRAFTSDNQAKDYVASHSNEIVGYIQEPHREKSREGGPVDGVAFFNDVIDVLTPSAKTLFYCMAGDSGLGDHRLFTSGDDRIRFRSKTLPWRELEPDLIWLIEPLKSPDQSSESSETATLIELVQVPWSHIRAYLTSHPDYLHRMPPRRFEELIAEIYREHGWLVELTSRTRDGGYDIFAVRRNIPTDLRILIEAKRWRPDRPVGVGIIRSLYSVRLSHPASQVVLATSSHVSSDAKREFARVVPWELDFLERDAILSWCKQSSAVSIDGDP